MLTALSSLTWDPQTLPMVGDLFKLSPGVQPFCKLCWRGTSVWLWALLIYPIVIHCSCALGKEIWTPNKIQQRFGAASPKMEKIGVLWGRVKGEMEKWAKRRLPCLEDAELHLR